MGITRAPTILASENGLALPLSVRADEDFLKAGGILAIILTITHKNHL